MLNSSAYTASSPAALGQARPILPDAQVRLTDAGRCQAADPDSDGRVFRRCVYRPCLGRFTRTANEMASFGARSRPFQSSGEWNGHFLARTHRPWMRAAAGAADSARFAYSA